MKLLRNYVGVGIEDKIKTLTLAFSESSLNPNVNHNSTAVGYCGIKPEYWKSYLNERGIKVRSVLSCLEVYNYYYDRYKNQRKALRRYKGIRSHNNEWIINKVLRVEKHLINKFVRN
jgi:hypothetical protein